MRQLFYGTANWTASEGSTIVEFSESYMKTLSNGTHTVTIVSNDGEAEDTFIVEGNTEAGQTEEPEEGSQETPAPTEAPSQEPVPSAEPVQESGDQGSTPAPSAAAEQSGKTDSASGNASEKVASASTGDTSDAIPYMILLAAALRAGGLVFRSKRSR